VAWNGPEPPPPLEEDDTRAERGASPTRTRLSSTWTFAALGAVVLLLLLVFILQNTQKVDLEFLWFDFRLPMGVALLLAGAIGALLAVLLAASRLLQLRLAARRRRAHDR
jgi:uncharacterized integral membrane protein